MVKRYASLDKADCEELIRCLEGGLRVFDSKSALFTTRELHVHSMIAALRSDLKEHLEEADNGLNLRPE